MSGQGNIVTTQSLLEELEARFKNLFTPSEGPNAFAAAPRSQAVDFDALLAFVLELYTMRHQHEIMMAYSSFLVPLKNLSAQLEEQLKRDQQLAGRLMAHLKFGSENAHQVSSQPESLYWLNRVEKTRFGHAFVALGQNGFKASSDTISCLEKEHQLWTALPPNLQASLKSHKLFDAEKVNGSMGNPGVSITSFLRKSPSEWGEDAKERVTAFVKIPVLRARVASLVRQAALLPLAGASLSKSEGYERVGQGLLALVKVVGPQEKIALLLEHPNLLRFIAKKATHQYALVVTSSVKRHWMKSYQSVKSASIDGSNRWTADRMLDGFEQSGSRMKGILKELLSCSDAAQTQQVLSQVSSHFKKLHSIQSAAPATRTAPRQRRHSAAAMPVWSQVRGNEASHRPRAFSDQLYPKPN